MLEPLFDVIRIDDYGTTFVVKQNLNEREATVLVRQLTEKGHKQVYVARPKIEKETP